MRLAVVASILLCAVRIAASAPRVILVSWDGAGYVMTSRLLAEGRLPHLQRMVREGAWTDGMVTSFPTKTAAAHAVLFTGHYGHTSGITGNWLLRQPKSLHDRLTVERGYFSDALRVDPLWVLVARAGRNAYALHATQAYPFDSVRRSLTPEERRQLFIIHGYTEVQLRGEAFDEDSAPIERPHGWAIPEAADSASRAFSFRVGETDFSGLFFDDPLDPERGVDTLGIVRQPSGRVFEARLKPGADGVFSVPIAATSADASVWFSLRLFELDASAESFLLYRSGAVELVHSNPDTPKAEFPAMRAFAGNSGTMPYRDGAFGATVGNRGDGRAENYFRETLDHLQAQLIAQARVVLEEDYGLVVLYSPVTDDVVHELAGYLDPDLAGYDADLAQRAWDVVADGFALQDRFLGVVLEAAKRDGAHVVLVSDHGIGGTDRLVRLNIALSRSGFVALNADRSIDLSGTRALALPLADGSIAVNTIDRPGGIVPLEERAEVLNDVKRALGELKDPNSGEPLITALFEPATTGLLQPGGESTGDLFVELSPGLYQSTSTDVDAIVSSTQPRGNHIFAPTRREMLAICAVWGPRVPAGTNYGKVRAIDVVPTVLDILELDRSENLPGQSLVHPRTLLKAK